MGRVGRPSQEPGGDQGLERLRDPREGIPDVLGQTLGDEVGPRMPREEQQQIEITRVPQAPKTVKEIPDALGRHAFGRHEGSHPNIPTRRAGPVVLADEISKSAAAGCFPASTLSVTSIMNKATGSATNMGVNEASRGLGAGTRLTGSGLELGTKKRSCDCLGTRLPYALRLVSVHRYRRRPRSSSRALALREFLDLLLRHRLQPRQKAFHLPLRRVISQDEVFRLRLRPEDVGHPVVQTRRASPDDGETADPQATASFDSCQGLATRLHRPQSSREEGQISFDDSDSTVDRCLEHTIGDVNTWFARIKCLSARLWARA